jgi:hypothetical protein
MKTAIYNFKRKVLKENFGKLFSNLEVMEQKPLYRVTKQNKILATNRKLEGK